MWPVKLGARLAGLGLIVLGFVGMGLVYLIWTFGAAPAFRPPLPPGVRADLVPIVSPFTCIVPLVAVASALLVLEGLRRLVSPE